MNNFLVFGEGPTDDINGSFGTAEEKISINRGQLFLAKECW